MSAVDDVLAAFDGSGVKDSLSAEQETASSVSDIVEAFDGPGSGKSIEVKPYSREGQRVAGYSRAGNRFIRVHFYEQGRAPVLLGNPRLGLNGIEGHEVDAHGMAKTEGNAILTHNIHPDEISKIVELRPDFGKGDETLLVPRESLTDGPAKEHLDLMYLAGEKPWIATLTHDEQDALRVYVSADGFQEINRSLRSGDPDKDSFAYMSDRHRGDSGKVTPKTITRRTVSEWEKLIDAAMAKAPPTDATLALFVYRGVRDLSALFGPDGPKVGQKITDRGYVSTSTDVVMARNFATQNAPWIPKGDAPDPAVLEITAPPGVRGAWMASIFGSGFNEFTLPHGSSFVVTDVRSDSVVSNDLLGEMMLKHVEMKLVSEDASTKGIEEMASPVFDIVDAFDGPASGKSVHVMPYVREGHSVSGYDRDLSAALDDARKPLQDLVVKYETSPASRASPQTFRYLIADDKNGKRVANVSYRSDNFGVWVDGIAVDKGRRGEGIARALLAELHVHTGKPILHGSFSTLEGLEFGITMSAAEPEWNKLVVGWDGDYRNPVFWNPDEPLTNFDFAAYAANGYQGGKVPDFASPLNYGLYRRANGVIDRALAKGRAIRQKGNKSALAQLDHFTALRMVTNSQKAVETKATEDVRVRAHTRDGHHVAAYVRKMAGKPPWEMTPEEFAAHPKTWWHGTIHGEMNDSAGWSGVHVGTYEAAREALAARSGWDLGPRGTIEDRQALARAQMRKWIGEETKHADGSFTYTRRVNFGPNVPEKVERVTVRFDGDTVEIVKPTQPPRSTRVSTPPKPAKPNYAREVAIRSASKAWLGVRQGDEVYAEPRDPKKDGPAFWSKTGTGGEGPGATPAIIPMWIVGDMTNEPRGNLRDDFWANGVMASLLKRGKARRGMYYRNVSEDSGSVSAVVPSRTHLATHEDFVNYARAHGHKVHGEKTVQVKPYIRDGHQVSGYTRAGNAVGAVVEHLRGDDNPFSSPDVYAVRDYPELRDAVIDAWHGFKFGDLVASVESFVHPPARPIFVTGGIYHGDEKIGEYERQFTDNPAFAVNHRSMRIAKPLQGAGFASAFYRESEDMYRKLGYSRINISATSVGGYAWARQGFKFSDPEDLRKVMGRLNDLDDLVMQGHVTKQDAQRFIAQFPAPSELDEMTNLDRYAAKTGKFSTPAEIAAYGRDKKWTDEHDREMWLGKWFLLDNSWDGIKDIAANTKSVRESLAAAYATWALQKEREGGRTMSGYGDDGNQFFDDDNELWDAILAASDGQKDIHVSSYERDGHRVAEYVRHDENGTPRDPASGDGWWRNSDGVVRWGRYGAAGVLFRNQQNGVNRYFLQQRGIGTDSGGTWAYPGGALDRGEAPLDGALREASEELGHDPTGGDPQVASTYVHQPADDWAYTTHVVDMPNAFVAKLDSWEGNSGESGWFTHEQMQKLPLHPAVRDTIDHILGGKKSLDDVIAAFDGTAAVKEIRVSGYERDGHLVQSYTRHGDEAAQWVRLGERSGVPEIDASIDAFAKRGYIEYDDPENPKIPLDALKHPDEAEGLCSTVSLQFANFARAHGLHAYDSGENVNTPDYARHGNPLLGSDHGPDAFGYHDRTTRDSEYYPEHSATVIEHGGRTYTVDWAAAQYGYKEFPLVQQAQSGKSIERVGGYQRDGHEVRPYTRHADEGRVPLAQIIYIAEDVMKRGGENGRTWVTPKGHLDETPEIAKQQRAMSEYASKVFLSGGGKEASNAHEFPGSLPVRVIVDDYDLDQEGSGTFASAHRPTMTIRVRHTTDDMTLIHETAHLLTDTSSGGEGHTAEFALKLHDLYGEFLGPRAAQTFWNLVAPRADGKAAGRVSAYERDGHHVSGYVRGGPKPLPIEPGLYYRFHHKDAPFGLEHAYSAPVHVPEGIRERNPDLYESFVTPKKGYSAFWNPHHLDAYLHEMSWDSAADTKDRHVIMFRGVPVGEGSDGEPLVVPSKDKIEHKMSLRHFRDRLDWTDNGYGDWQMHPWNDGPNGAQVHDPNAYYMAPPTHLHPSHYEHQYPQAADANRERWTKTVEQVAPYVRDGHPVRAFTRHTTFFPNGLLVNPDYTARVIEKRRDEQKLRGIGYGGTVGYQNAAQEHMQKLFQDASVSLRMKPDKIPAMLEYGRYRNRADQEIPRLAFAHPGADDPRTREGAEVAVWGQHPVYGYLSTEGERLDGPMTAYGDAKLVLKPDVRKRTTMTWGDSLYGIVNHTMLPSPVDQPSTYSVTPDARDVFERDSVNPIRQVRSFLVDGYVEAQILGGVHVSDIDHIRFTSQPSDEVVAALKNAGIPWAVGSNNQPGTKFFGFAARASPENPAFDALHPRGHGGVFIDKTIVRKIGNVRATRTWKTAMRRPAYVGETSYHGDSFMHDLAEDFGFSGKPTKVTEAQLAHEISDGGDTELWRGVTDLSYADTFIGGPYYAGTGFRANGIYVSYGPQGGRMAHGYASSISGHGTLVDKHEHPTIIHMALKKQAKIVNYEEIAGKAKAEAMRLKKTVDDKSASDRDRAAAEVEMRIALDPGKYAMSLGYDAMRVDDDEYAIFNRTALLVSDEFKDGTKSISDVHAYVRDGHPVAGYEREVVDASYRGSHEAPDRESGAPLHDVTGIFPEDIYSANGVRYYGSQGGAMDVTSVGIIHRLRGKPNATVKVYRSVPRVLTNAERIDEYERQKKYILRTGKVPPNIDDHGLTHSHYYDWIHDEIERLKNTTEPKQPEHDFGINRGDWVTINRAYAKQHGISNLGSEYKIISKTVHARDVYTEGDIHEWGYDPTAKEDAK